MERDLLYKASLLQGLAKQWPQFAAIASRHTTPVENELIDEAMLLAAGCKEYHAAPIEELPMRPVFANVGQGIDGNWTLPAQELVLTKDYFAKKETTQRNHKPQLERLSQEIGKLGNMSPKAFAETMLTLLYKYAGQIPSGIKGLDDVSLYDYLKMTAAIAVTLRNGAEKQQSEKPFLLIGADFSGIQQYIYTIVSKRAAKSLKGRSFYLRLLSDTIVRYLLKELELYNANVIYNSGGSFYILAANNQETRDKIATAIKRIEDALFKELGTQLFVAIDYVELSLKALLGEGESLSDTWRELFLKRDSKKNHKLSTILKERYEELFDTGSANVKMMKDSISGEDFLPGEKVYRINGDNGNDLKLRPITALQIEIGKVLRNTDVLIVTDTPIPGYDALSATPLELGITYYFADSRREPDSKLASLGDKANIVTLNGSNGKCSLHHLSEGCTNIFTIEFYGGNEMRKIVNTYEEMSEGDGFTRMGVLRMDVDNLGTIFQSGITASLSRYAALSRSFDYFFSGYLNTIWESYNPEKSQIIYSGGDDLFIVGRWDIAIELAQRIRNDFKEYTCYNESFSLSGGVAIVPPKFPIMAAAEESASEESKAKEHVCGNRPKDAISFMGTPLNWEKEYPVVKKLKTTLLNYLQKKAIPSSFIQKILQFSANAQIENHTIGNMKTFWMVAYDTKRTKNRIPNNNNSNEIKGVIENFKKEVCEGQCGTLNNAHIESDYHPLELWALAARWAELENRTK